jgi:hypothetical protein
MISGSLPVSDRTRESHWTCVRKLSEHFAKASEDVSPEELRQYFNYLKCEKKIARQTATQAICAIKLFGMGDPLLAGGVCSGSSSGGRKP